MMLRDKVAPGSLPILVAAVICLGASAVHAAELTGELNVQAGVTDNLLREVEPPDDTPTYSAGFLLDFEGDSQRYDAVFNAQYDYLNYDDDRVDNEWIGGAFGRLDLFLVPNRVTWQIADNYGQITTDPFQPPNVNNRENVNILQTGPILQLLPEGRNQLRFRGQLVKTNFELQPNDSDSELYELNFSRATNRTSNFIVTASEQNFEIESQVENFRRRQASVGWTTEGAQTTLSTSLGWTWLENGGEENEGVFLNFNMTRELTQRGFLTLAASTRYADQGDIFLSLQNTAEEFGQTFVQNNVGVQFRDTNARITYVLNADNRRIIFNVAWADEDYEGRSDLGVDTQRARFYYRKELSRAWYWDTDIRYLRRDYFDLDRLDEEYAGSIAIGRNLGVRTTLDLRYSYRDRNSTAANAAFHENRVFLRLGYTPEWLE